MSVLLFMTPDPRPVVLFFFFNDTATTEIYTLSLHDALPIFYPGTSLHRVNPVTRGTRYASFFWTHSLVASDERSEEHTSELQSQSNLVCRLLLEKKKKKSKPPDTPHTCASDSAACLPTLHAA